MPSLLTKTPLRCALTGIALGFVAGSLISLIVPALRSSSAGFWITMPVFTWLLIRHHLRMKGAALASQQTPAIAPATIDPVQTMTLEELRTRKRLLEIEKRQLNQNMRNVREAARADRINVDRPFSNLGLGALLFGSRTWKSAQRKGIRNVKQAGLSVLQDKRNEIERQITEIELRIIEMSNSR